MSPPASGNLGLASSAPAGGAAALAVLRQLAQHSARTPSSGRPEPHAAENPLERIGGHIPLPAPVPDWSRPIIIALLLLVIWLGVRSRLSALRARRLERQRTTLLGDLDVMQAALVPAVPASLGGLAVSVAYRPADGPAAGGDFYDLFIPEPGKVAIVLGDVAGHGHEALTHAALTRYTLRAYLQAGLEPRAALALAGRVLADPMSERFATVAVGLYDSAGSTLTYALAGHPPPILCGVKAREPVTVCSSPPIGWDKPTGQRQTTVSLPAGAAACFFSDGLIEARCGGELLGRERLREILGGLGSEPAAGDLLAGVRAATEGAPDDMVACMITPESTAVARAVRVEELEVDAQTVSRGEVRRFLGECGVPAADIARAIESASAITESSGSALLCIELGAAAKVTATAVSGGSRIGSARSERSAGEPLLGALVTG